MALDVETNARIESWRVEDVVFAPDLMQPGILYHEASSSIYARVVAGFVIHVPTTGHREPTTGRSRAPETHSPVEGSFSHRCTAVLSYWIVSGRPANGT